MKTNHIVNTIPVKQLIAALTIASGAEAIHAACPPDFPEKNVFSAHFEQKDIVDNRFTFRKILRKGKELFVEKANLCDGQGRPATTGGGDKRLPDQPSFIRTSAPESNSCSGCHAQPFVGGSGDFVANVFVLAQALDPVTESVSSEFSNERNTLGMHGSGPIEMVAREMTASLQAQAQALTDGSHTLMTKGVEFDITIDNGVVVDAIGIDTDLIVKPFHQAGVVVSLREFTVNAMNHHHGLQAEERFDLNPEKGYDFDEDGVLRELTIGDITALTLYQAALGTPIQVMPKHKRGAKMVRMGEALFSEIGCASCHIPSLPLNNAVYSEPNPFNPPGTFSDVSQSYSFDMRKKGDRPRLERKGKKGAVVKAYTDLKRHNLCDSEDQEDAIRFYCNEHLKQGRVGHDGRDGSEYFITRKLWDAGSSAPYGHRGDLGTLTEAIMYHGGEARESRDNFMAMSKKNKKRVIQFLKSLQVVSSTR